MYRARPTDGIAWVTGASSGIGQAVAVALQRRGYRVVVTARNTKALAALAEQAKPTGTILAAPGDVTDREAMAALVERIEAEHGAIALAFLNVGTYFPDGIDGFGGKPFEETFRTNVFGTVYCLAPLIRVMRERRSGQIAINGSVAGYGGLPRASAYGASKAALINLAESLKFGLDRAGVTIQIVNPGFVKTPLTDQNDFPMPFLVPLAAAAERICRGFERDGFEIAFPRRMAWLLKGLNMLPYRAYFWLVSKATGRAC
jgi:NAD(P)-dependent dehydrogenase (short-subunit alcohol dehydrogenase family)